MTVAHWKGLRFCNHPFCFCRRRHQDDIIPWQIERLKRHRAQRSKQLMFFLCSWDLLEPCGDNLFTRKPVLCPLLIIYRSKNISLRICLRHLQDNLFCTSQIGQPITHNRHTRRILHKKEKKNQKDFQNYCIEQPFVTCWAIIWTICSRVRKEWIVCPSVSVTNCFWAFQRTSGSYHFSTAKEDLGWIVCTCGSWTAQIFAVIWSASANETFWFGRNFLSPYPTTNHCLNAYDV